MSDCGIIHVSGLIDRGASENVCKEIIEYNTSGKTNPVMNIPRKISISLHHLFDSGLPGTGDENAGNDGNPLHKHGAFIPRETT